MGLLRLGGQPSAPAGRAARARSFCDPARGQRKVVSTTTAREKLQRCSFRDGIGAHCPSAFPFLSAKIPGRCRRSRGRAIQRGRGPARLRRGHELGGWVGPAHQTAPGPASRVRMPRTACALVCLSTRAGLLSLLGLNAGVGVVQVVRGVAELHGAEEAAAPARVKRVQRRVGGAKSCRRRSPSCLGGADSPSGGVGALRIPVPARVTHVRGRAQARWITARR